MLSADFSNFLPCFEDTVNRTKTAKSKLFVNFKGKNPYEIDLMAIQTQSLECKQTGIQTVSTKNFRQKFQL